MKALFIPLILLSLIIPHSLVVFAQMPVGEIVNSKYLNVTEQRYREGLYGDQITGEITNVSPLNISNVRAYVTLFDKDNQIITIEFGAADVFTLPAGDYSAFNIPLTGLKGKESINHYVISPGGIPY